MPTYENRHGKITTIGEWQFAPFEKRAIPRNIFVESPVVQIDNSPEYNPYKIVIPRGSNTSKPFLHNHSLVVRIDDIFPPDFYAESATPSGSGSLDLGVFATIGQHTINSTYQLALILKFTKVSGHWITTNNTVGIIPQMLIDKEYEVIYLKILNGSSNVDISVKPF